MSFNPLDYPIAFTTPQHLSDVSAWIDHIPFAFTITAMTRPRTFVELGSHKGDSYLAFCQAVKQLNLQTRCTAVDTWQGDAHAGAYDASVLMGLRAAHDPQYSSFSTLMQTTFDDAVGKFEDGTIDLLHIDGLHTYEAVRHDYETWLPKLSPRGVVLFHDTAVLDRGFGVYQLFAELAAKHPAFTFHHGFGLGIVAPGAEVPAAVQDFLSAATQSPDPVRNYFATLGQRIQFIRLTSASMNEAFRTQVMLNAAMRHIHLPVDPKSDLAHTAMANPIAFLAAQRGALESFLRGLNRQRR